MIEKIGVAGLMWAALCALAPPVLAQDTSGAKSTWRCGNTYSDQPCQGGKVINVNDPRSASDRRAADTATQRTVNSANTMERERLQLERAADERARFTVIADARAKAEQAKTARIKTSPKPPKKHKPGRLPPDYFTAHGADAPAKKPAKVSSK